MPHVSISLLHTNYVVHETSPHSPMYMFISCGVRVVSEQLTAHCTWSVMTVRRIVTATGKGIYSKSAYFSEMDCRSQWLRSLRRRSAAARLLRLWVRIPPGYGCQSVVSVVCCQVEVYDELITRPEECYRLWCVVVCDLETS
jgi:hypothetical protein